MDRTGIWFLNSTHFSQRFSSVRLKAGVRLLLKKVEDYVIRLNKALGYDFNTVELAVRDGIPYAIDFCNPAPDADAQSVGEENFDWIIENAANLAIEKAKIYEKGKVNLTWGTFISESVQRFDSSSKKSGKAEKSNNSEKLAAKPKKTKTADKAEKIASAEKPKAKAKSKAKKK